jgi:hypothetical protein
MLRHERPLHFYRSPSQDGHGLDAPVLAQNFPLTQCNRAAALSRAAPSGPQILVNWISNFSLQLMHLEHARFLHIICDLRDVLLSGMRYHRVAPLGNETVLRKDNSA